MGWGLRSGDGGLPGGGGVPALANLPGVWSGLVLAPALVVNIPSANAGDIKEARV